MTDLVEQLQELAPAVEWPETPGFAPRLARRRRPYRRQVLVLVAVAVLAVAIASAVPPARSAVLRLLHLGGVSVERVEVLPPAQERPLAVSLGSPVSPGVAETALGRPFRLPAVSGMPRLYEQDGVVSTLLATPEPVLLSELRAPGPILLKKVAGLATNVEQANVGQGVDAIWISGEPHVVFFAALPARLAGNALVWVRGNVTYRLEGASLTEDDAVRLAREIDGT